MGSITFSSGQGVRCFTVDSAGNFYCGGSFASGLNKIAKWDPGTSAWVGVGTGPGLTGNSPNNNVRALTAFGTNIIAGGDFTGAAGVANTQRIALWDTTAMGWVSLGGIPNGTVRLLASFTFGASPAVLIAGGDFTTVNGGAVAASRIAQWDGTNYTAVARDGRQRD